MFKKICIIGVGLIGGSIARAARERGLCQHIVGLGRESNWENLQKAKQLGVIDEFYFDTKAAVQEADCIVIATPVGAIENIFAALKEHWSQTAVYTDAGSTKGSVIAAATKVFGEVPRNFVPAHPIAGAEHSGVGAAVPDLFINKRLIITPVADTAGSALNKIEAFWTGMGAIVSSMDVVHHDAILAATSHLPHILAYSLVNMLGKKDEQVEIFKFAAGGFKDFTRIASSSPNMWLDICMANREEIIPLIHQLQDCLGSIAQMLETQDSEQLFDTFTYAKQSRQRFLDQIDN
jgi:prephenate dehydrogenase